MQTAKIIEGLTILEKYRDKPDGYNTGAEHDVVYAYETDKPVEQPDLSRMFELGWRQEEPLPDESEDIGDDTVEFHVRRYNPRSSWRAYA